MGPNEIERILNDEDALRYFIRTKRARVDDGHQQTQRVLGMDSRVSVDQRWLKNGIRGCVRREKPDRVTIMAD